MNKNLSQAVKVIREAMASSGSDPSAAIAHALNEARLLVDPEQTFGAVLNRTTAGGWARAVDAANANTAVAAPPETEVERQAAAWDQACARAQHVADTIQAALNEHPSFQSVQVDRDSVLVSLHITDQAQWPAWRTYFGIQYDQEKPTPWVTAGAGYRDGVRVSVLAYDLPEARAHALKIAKAPVEIDGTIYDLARPQRDSAGDVWFYQGVRTADGMPLLSVDGRPERCSLVNIARMNGPLTPVIDGSSQQATPVMTGAEGGERA